MPTAHPVLPAAVRPPVQPLAQPPARPPVRLTRRGRVVLLVVCLLLAAAVAALAAPASRAADPAPGSPGSPEPAVAVVRPGDTLWSVVARHVPSHDAYGMIEEIRRLNDLSGHTIHPGQELILPSR